jgi:hypothetical protein
MTENTMTEGTLICEMPGGPEFIAWCLSTAADLALYLAGLPDDRVAAELESRRILFETGLADEMGAEAARQIANAFVATVARCRAEIEHAALGAGNGTIQ